MRERWNKLKYWFRECIVLPLVIVTSGWIYVKNKYPSVPGRLYVMIYQGIGDIIVSMGYLGAYLERHEGEFQEIYLILVKRNKQVYAMYPPPGQEQKYRYIILTQREYQFFCVYHETPIGFKSINARNDFLFIHTYNFIKDNWNYFYRMPGMTFMYFIKRGIYGLDDNAAFTYPRVMELAKQSRDNLDESYALRREKVIILNPYANTIFGEVPDDFWRYLAARLCEDGYSVYTDCGKGDKEVVPGTKAITVSLKELNYICKHIEGYIGLRSGLLDYILFAGCKVIAIYPGEVGRDGNEVFQAFDINGINQLMDTPINTN
ncbi:MAG: hypothetical protein K2N34_03125, partial [Lachnospiraceae bacterium]|nr:hypothetical protein [Lachnospiraceae bacterium]